VQDKLNNLPNSVISGKFHQTLVEIFVEVTRHLANKTGIQTVAFSGGCFQNRFLSQQLKQRLQQDFQVLTPRNIPANDMGISAGQVFYALKRSEKFS
ncbi:MAG: carbamoyltransferase HypF, partial [SAR324 cluster bacterium]|nr:carbamoyltransferase HypF [SAR324 cluster bacterium]